MVLVFFLCIGAEKIDWKLLGVELQPAKQPEKSTSDKKISKDTGTFVVPNNYYRFNDIYTQPRVIQYFRHTEYICPTYK